jgi:predicted alpha/beta hydrolase family esterase
MDFVIVPGIDNSGEQHWQTRWEEDWGPRAGRIDPASWTVPDLDDWCAAITAAIGQHGPDTVLVTHSLGCLAAAEWLVRHGSGVRGAFLVAPPDAGAPAFPQAAPSFRAAIPARLPVAAVVIASDDDPYCTPAAAARLAGAWKVPLVSAGARGHLNTASGIGDWQAGRDLLTAFTAGLRA